MNAVYKCNNNPVGHPIFYLHNFFTKRGATKKIKTKLGEKKKRGKIRSFIRHPMDLIAPSAMPAAGLAAPVGGGGLKAASLATWFGIAAVPVSRPEM
jgi:hypothetical protein